MAIPLDLLINNETNVYELTALAIKDAEFIAKYGDPEIEEHNGKIVSTAVAQVLEDRVKYAIEKKES